MTHDFSSARVLVLDDLPANTALVVRILDWAGFSNVMALNDQEHLEERLREFDPDVLILDLHMPGRDGYEILKTLREATYWASLPVLVFTADVTPAAKARAFEAGATDYLTKPGEAVEVTMRVTSAVRTSFLQRKLRQDAQRLGQGLLSERKRMLMVEEGFVDRMATISALRSPQEAALAARVAPVAAKFARYLGERDLANQLERAMLVRSIGIVGVSDELGTSEEQEKQSAECRAAEQIFQDSKTDLLRVAGELAANRYERWDGSGVPGRLAGENLPLSSRIVQVAEAFVDATDRNADNPLKAVQLGGGHGLDPELAAKFEELHDTKEAAA